MAPLTLFTPRCIRFIEISTHGLEMAHKITTFETSADFVCIVNKNGQVHGGQTKGICSFFLKVFMVIRFSSM